MGRICTARKAGFRAMVRLLAPVMDIDKYSRSNQMQIRFVIPETWLSNITQYYLNTKIPNQNAFTVYLEELVIEYTHAISTPRHTWRSYSIK